MKKKRLLASIVAAAMMFTMVPSYAFADDSTVPMIDLVPATPTESTQTDVPDTTECTMTADCTAEVHQEGCPAAKPETQPEENTCTMSADCTAEEHQEGCPAAEPVAEEPEVETETETDEQTSCTKTKGCTLLEGHEGDCEVPEDEPEQEQEDEEIPVNEPVMLDMDIPEETCTVDYSKQQSDGVTYDGYDYDETQKIYKFHYTISENAGDELIIDLGKGGGR